jgi:hypothetical protein
MATISSPLVAALRSLATREGALSQRDAAYIAALGGEENLGAAGSTEVAEASTVPKGDFAEEESEGDQ